MNAAKRNLIMGLICFVVGVFCALFWADRVDGKRSRCTETVRGTVTWVTEMGSGEDISYRVEIEYVIGGEKHSYSRTSGTRLEQGESVTVHYDPGDHNTVYIEELGNSPFMFRLAGGVFAAVGLGMVIKSIIEMKKK